MPFCVVAVVLSFVVCFFLFCGGGERGWSFLLGGL